MKRSGSGEREPTCGCTFAAVLKLPCYVCGGSEVQAYHEDYAKPLEVTWLCRVHHRMVTANDLCLLGHQTPVETNLRRRCDKPVMLPGIGMADDPRVLLLRFQRARAANGSPPVPGPGRDGMG